MEYNKDLHCIELCVKHIKKMRAVFDEFGIKTLEDFEGSETCQLAITQLVTNIHEPSKKIGDDLTAQMPLFSKQRKRIKVSRNISSHDYESVDWEIVYKLVCDLTKDEIIAELEGVANELRND